MRRLLERLSSYMASLQRLAAFPREEVLGDPDRIASVKYHFIVSIECCIDLANHVIASEKLRAPLDYADSFSVLVEAGVLEEEAGAKMRDAARFRNRLVHIYWDVEDDLVIDYLQNERDTFNRFARAVAGFSSS